MLGKRSSDRGGQDTGCRTARGRSAGARDHGRRSELVSTVIGSVEQTDAGSCRHGGIGVGRSVTALVAIGDGGGGETAWGVRSWFRGGEVQHGGNDRTRWRGFAIVGVIVSSGMTRAMYRTATAM